MIAAISACSPAVYAAGASAHAGDRATVELADREVPQIKPRQGGIFVTVPGESPVHVTIYAITGQAVKSFDAQPGLNEVDLGPGCYIVRTATHSAKVIVK